FRSLAASLVMAAVTSSPPSRRARTAVIAGPLVGLDRGVESVANAQLHRQPSLREPLLPPSYHRRTGRAGGWTRERHGRRFLGRPLSRARTRRRRSGRAGRPRRLPPRPRPGPPTWPPVRRSPVRRGPALRTATPRPGW